jgi:hypothetical protein
MSPLPALPPASAFRDPDGRRGTLTTKSAASFQLGPSGDLLDQQTVVSGTGGFSGATGTLHLSGNFVGTSGASTYSGHRLCSLSFPSRPRQKPLPHGRGSVSH